MYRSLNKYIVYVQVPKQVYCICTGPYKYQWIQNKLEKEILKVKWKYDMIDAWLLELYVYECVKK